MDSYASHQKNSSSGGSGGGGNGGAWTRKIHVWKKALFFQEGWYQWNPMTHETWANEPSVFLTSFFKHPVIQSLFRRTPTSNALDPNIQTACDMITAHHGTKSLDLAK